MFIELHILKEMTRGIESQLFTFNKITTNPAFSVLEKTTVLSIAVQGFIFPTIIPYFVKNFLCYLKLKKHLLEESNQF